MNKPMSVPRLSAVAVSVSLSLLPWSAFAQLEEIVVTAQRRETNLQTTPISIQAFSAEDLELGGIEAGRDLGIMVPNHGRMVFTPAEGNWSANVWMTNITDEQYVNGGFDTRTVWGYNFSIVGPPREFGAGRNIRF